MTNNDGGPAFPGEYAITMRHPEGGDETRMISGDGMTLRDWFAGQASWPEQIGSSESGTSRLSPVACLLQPIPHLAHACYLVADAMLAEREKRNDN